MKYQWHTHNEKRKSKNLAVVKSSLKSQIVHVWIEHRGHLELLNWRDLSLGVEDVDRDVPLASEAVDGRTTKNQTQKNKRVNIPGAQVVRDPPTKEQREADLPVSPLVAPTMVRKSCPPFRAKKKSKRFPRNWSATSLKAKFR